VRFCRCSGDGQNAPNLQIAAETPIAPSILIIFLTTKRAIRRPQGRNVVINAGDEDSIEVDQRPCSLNSV